MTTDTGGVFLSLRYDMRAPAFGVPADALYRAQTGDLQAHPLSLPRV